MGGSMWAYIFRRLWQMIPTVFGVIIITFVLFNLVGGSPAAMTLGRNVSAQLLEEFDEVRGFNKPIIMGLWSGTRAFETARFERNAEPWRNVDGVTHDGTGFVRFEEGNFPVPLQFRLRAETGFRWTLRYRLPEGSAAFLRYGQSGDEEEPQWDHIVPLTPSTSWRVARIQFETTDAPARLQPELWIEQGVLELDSIALDRRANHIFDSQFFHYLGQVFRFDLGRSAQTDQRISEMLRAGIWPSLSLTVPIFVIGLVVAIALSLICAFFRDTWLDRFFVVFAVALMSINYLVWIIVGQYLMAFKWGWFPVWGFESMAYLMLPVIIGVVSGLGTDLRFYRTVMLDEMYKEYVRTAFAKGVSRKRVLFVHVLKNAMITVTTNVVIAIPFLYTGSLLLESFFGIPGLGFMGINAINSSDVDVIRAIVLIGSILYVFANLLTDICYAWVDPRVKLK